MLFFACTVSNLAMSADIVSGLYSAHPGVRKIAAELALKANSGSPKLLKALLHAAAVPVEETNDLSALAQEAAAKALVKHGRASTEVADFFLEVERISNNPWGPWKTVSPASMQGLEFIKKMDPNVLDYLMSDLLNTIQSGGPPTKIETMIHLLDKRLERRSAQKILDALLHEIPELDLSTPPEPRWILTINVGIFLAERGARSPQLYIAAKNFVSLPSSSPIWGHPSQESALILLEALDAQSPATKIAIQTFLRSARERKDQYHEEQALKFLSAISRGHRPVSSPEDTSRKVLEIILADIESGNTQRLGLMASPENHAMVISGLDPQERIEMLERLMDVSDPEHINQMVEKIWDRHLDHSANDMRKQLESSPRCRAILSLLGREGRIDYPRKN